MTMQTSYLRFPFQAPQVNLFISALVSVCMSEFGGGGMPISKWDIKNPKKIFIGQGQSSTWEAKQELKWWPTSPDEILNVIYLTIGCRARSVRGGMW